jgi:hypothetical protein
LKFIFREASFVGFTSIQKMAAHLFNESGQMQEVDIPDIFDVLAGGEDENAVKYLLGFSAEDEAAAALMADGGGAGAFTLTPGRIMTQILLRNNISMFPLGSIKQAVSSPN